MQNVNERIIVKARLNSFDFCTAFRSTNLSIRNIMLGAFEQLSATFVESAEKG